MCTVYTVLAVVSIYCVCVRGHVCVQYMCVLPGQWRGHSWTSGALQVLCSLPLTESSLWNTKTGLCQETYIFYNYTDFNNLSPYSFAVIFCCSLMFNIKSDCIHKLIKYI